MSHPIARFDALLPHGITLSCRHAANADAGAPRVLLLHGFPEAAFIWDEVMLRLQPQADCVAPNLRGYAGSSAPVEVASYRMRHLVEDVAALIDLLAAPVDLVVAHDWGGAVAWALAAARPQLLRRLLIINAPHAATFLRELRHNPAQRAASAYMNALCRPDAEARLAENDHARLWGFFTRMGGERWLTDALRAQYREVWQQGLTGALNYYRASPLKPPAAPDDPRLDALAPDPQALQVDVPTTVLWGEADSALPPALLDGLEAWVPNLTVHRVPEATHWIVHERPALVASTIEHVLAK